VALGDTIRQSHRPLGDRVTKVSQIALLAIYAAVVSRAIAPRLILDLAVGCILAAALLWGLLRSPHPAAWFGQQPAPPVGPSVSHLHAWLAQAAHRHALGAALLAVATLVYGEAMARSWQPPQVPLTGFVLVLVLYNIWLAVGPTRPTDPQGSITPAGYRVSVLVLWLAAIITMLWLSRSVELTLGVGAVAPLPNHDL